MIDDEAKENRPLGMAGWRDTGGFQDFQELHLEIEAWRIWQDSLKPWDIRHDGMFAITDDGNYALLYWSGGEYPLDLTDIDSPVELLWSLMHVGKKLWRHSTSRRLTLLAEAICRAKGWRPFRHDVRLPSPEPHPNQAPPAFVDAEAERAKMTPQLRYQVIRRDGYRCRCCGYGVQEGARLHVDHIHPVSKGGKTEETNLQTLCWACNTGKGAS